MRLKSDAQRIGLGADHALRSVWTGQRRSRLRGRGLDFDEIRHYRPGDDIRHMDWRVTRRTGQPHVRGYNEERDRPVLLIVDQRLPMFFGSRLLMKSVAAAEAATLLAWSSLTRGDRVGWVFMGRQGLAHGRPSRRTEALLAQLTTLADMNTALQEHSAATKNKRDDCAPTLAAALEASARTLSHDGLVIIASDFADWDTRCFDHLRHLRRHNQALCLRISDPLERALAGTERMVVGDGEWQLALNQPDSDTRQHYSAAWDKQATALSASLGRIGIPLIDIDCANPTAAQLQRHLSRQLAS